MLYIKLNKETMKWQTVFGDQDKKFKEICYDINLIQDPKLTLEFLANNNFIPISETFFYRP